MIKVDTETRELTLRERSLVPRERLIIALVLSALGVVSLSVDMDVHRWFVAAHLPGDLRKLLTYSEVFAHGLGVLMIATTVAVLDPRRLRAAAFVLLNSLGAGLAADLGKITVGRIRPAHCPSLDVETLDTFVGWFPAATYSNYVGWFDSRFASFPSAHAATAAGLAVALSVLYPKGRWLFAFFALLAGLQRCYSYAHFGSDVWFGFAVGLLWTCLVWRIWPHGGPHQ